jgi:glucose/arabinose dehydrogenase
MMARALAAAAFGILVAASSCQGTSSSTELPGTAPALPDDCTLVSDGWGPTGTVPLHVETAFSGLEVPWDIQFLPGGDWLISERPGRIRLVSGGQLRSDPVMTLSTGEAGEGGLLGLALHPQFVKNGFFYAFYTTTQNSQTVNRIERFKLSSDHLHAASDRVLIDGIPAASFHDGGRIRFGPDGMLYAGTGDSGSPDFAQDAASLNGKILRISPDGGIPPDNPHAGSYVFAMGLRNPEAFDWADSQTMLVADNGPTGELGLTGLDKVIWARAGLNLGWPLITGCNSQSGLQTPILSWVTAAPPGGALIPHGSLVPEFDDNFLVAMMGIGDGSARQLHRVVLDPQSHRMTSHEVYLKDTYGRLRGVYQGPDGALYVTTTNCDSRGTCPPQKDVVLRVTKK